MFSFERIADVLELWRNDGSVSAEGRAAMSTEQEPGAVEQWLAGQPFGDAVAMQSLLDFARAHDAEDAERAALLARLVEALELRRRASQGCDQTPDCGGVCAGLWHINGSRDACPCACHRPYAHQYDEEVAVLAATRAAIELLK